jgi:TRAP-type C4-dicarboxylate transport system permease small subunit
MLIGAQISGLLHNGIVTSTGVDAASQWQVFWALPAAFAAIIMVVFAIMFRSGTSSATDRAPQTT